MYWAWTHNPLSHLRHGLRYQMSYNRSLLCRFSWFWKPKFELIGDLNFFLLLDRWVSVVEFHDPTPGIGKVFGQESTVVKWNYQILGLHQVTVRQKLSVILVIKWFKNWSKQKMFLQKRCASIDILQWKFFFEKFECFLT